ncbi:MAG: hypothetical protein C0404_06100 [Verrucomicrobia bacterium]|nr:hypothetical protein [Verrucomicrobiota bacterium]
MTNQQNRSVLILATAALASISSSLVAGDINAQLDSTNGSSVFVVSASNGVQLTKIYSDGRTIGGGLLNAVTGMCSTVGGGYGNAARASGATVAGGGGWDASDWRFRTNVASGIFSAVGGGGDNRALSSFDTVAGGRENQAKGSESVVGGGYANDALSMGATVAGGRINTAYGYGDFIGGGQGNDASNTYATVAGGAVNKALAYGASVLGGLYNEAKADYSTAGGRRSKANHQGSFVWSDSQDADFTSSNTNQFSFRCQGGARFLSGSGGANQQVAWSPGDASWTFSSDRNLKENFRQVDGAEVLEKVNELPITTWNYRGYDLVHMGPVAQEFHALFPLGRDENAIDGGDLHGVTLAAIQGLYRLVQEKDKKIAELEKRLSTLETRSGVK